MKKAVATFCLIGSTLALAACDTTQTAGDATTTAPYSMERTAKYDNAADNAVVSAPEAQAAQGDKVFQKAQVK